MARVQAKVAPRGGDEFLSRLRRNDSLPVSLLCVKPKFANCQERVGCGGTLRPVDVVKVPPKRRGPRQRMALAELHDNAQASVLSQGLDERPEIGDVVEHVVAYDDVGDGNTRRTVGPGALQDVVACAGILRELSEQGQKPGIGIHGEEAACTVGKRKTGRTRPGPDVKHGPVRR